MKPPILLALEPIRLVTTDAPPPPGSTWWDGWILLAGALLAAAGVVALVRFLLPRLGLRRDPGERAFRALARRLRLRRPQRAELRELAASVDAPPVALLLCRGAFVRAIRRGEEARGADPAQRSRLLELEHKVFG